MSRADTTPITQTMEPLVMLPRAAGGQHRDFLLRAPGVVIGACGAVRGRSEECGHIAMKPTVSPPAYCLPTFFVDGIEWNPKMGAPVDLTPGSPAGAPYTPTNVKGVEVYPSERNRPLRFTGDPTCGAVVIWTK